MRKMIKNTGKILIVSAMMIALVGCGPEVEEAKATDATTKSTTATEITTKEEVTTTTESVTETEEESTTEVIIDTSNTEGEDDSAPSAGGQIMFAYTADGAEIRLTEDSDGTWVSPDGVKYYLGDDGVLRARGYDDLFTTNPTEE